MCYLLAQDLRLNLMLHNNEKLTYVAVMHSTKRLLLHRSRSEEVQQQLLSLRGPR